MARAGLAVPADAPVQLPAYSPVLADIGDEQSLSANLSTFSGHLRRIQVKSLLLSLHPCAFFLFCALLFVFNMRVFKSTLCALYNTSSFAVNQSGICRQSTGGA